MRRQRIRIKTSFFWGLLIAGNYASNEHSIKKNGHPNLENSAVCPQF
jgi:hypothetical protein